MPENEVVDDVDNSVKDSKYKKTYVYKTSKKEKFWNFMMNYNKDGRKGKDDRKVERFHRRRLHIKKLNNRS
ncbi:MAG: hypothetical protein AABY32_01080 [Nanoarchaeota archaeon]